MGNGYVVRNSTGVEFYAVIFTDPVPFFSDSVCLGVSYDAIDKDARGDGGESNRYPDGSL